MIPLVWVIDDDASVRRALVRLIKSAGFESNGFASAEDLIKAGVPRSPACLVLDVHMVGMSGLELCDYLAASGISIPIILITAHDDVGVRERARKAGVSGYLRKPFDDQALIEALYKALGQAG
jgi:FixJ family two-component response regulator